MSDYPPRHHPCYMLESALKALGATAEVVRNADTLNCWGLRVNGKLMVWLIDNRMPHEAEHEDPAAKELLQRGVLVACAQKPDMERVGGRWLPLAATPGYMPKDMPKTCDVAMVGYVRDAARASILADVGARFSLSLAQGVFGQAAVDTYRQARVGLNIPSHYAQSYCYDINMRVFEIAATGIPLITNWLPELIELGFKPGVNCSAYTISNFMYIIKETIRQFGYRVEIGQAAAQLVAERHTYAHRAAQVLEWLS